MIIVHSETTKARRAKTELDGGQLVPPWECPERVDMILEGLRSAGLDDVQAPREHGLEPVLAVHDADYVDFLATCWDDWRALGRKGEAIAWIWPTRTMPARRIPRCVDGRLGHYALGADTSICAGTFEAAMASKDVALSALEHVLADGGPAFGLCRPPGHHAAVDQFGGYCFFNNAAIAARRALEAGKRRVAILDIDFHHGNGTQQIFYSCDDVLFLSIHGDPLECFPYFLGHADEVGEGDGAGYNVNYPLPPGTGPEVWLNVLEAAKARIAETDCELLIVSLGVDTFAGDPISAFRLASEDFLEVGERLAGVGLPAVFLMEGGYAVEEIGVNVANVLSGFERACAT
ncbi:histone deacetylase family protein [Halomonas ramblicola]|uniref:histone deacetylase family protein n=1 Tax=Halomonas ramblicola TaxID=747349 RepID=UPI0025B51626|nr:histone deacetylase family protein [Halomonas ramblicola]MDN3520492.1 histone deacetylase family protein [Halomonas ramblicola]